jgi:hypothetical protein
MIGLQEGSKHNLRSVVGRVWRSEGSGGRMRAGDSLLNEMRWLIETARSGQREANATGAARV